MDPNDIPPYDSDFWNNLDIDWGQVMNQHNLSPGQSYPSTIPTTAPLPVTTSSTGSYLYGSTITSSPYSYNNLQLPQERRRYSRASSQKRSMSMSVTSNISSLTTYLPPTDHRRTLSIRSHNHSPTPVARKSSNTSSTNDDSESTTQAAKDDLPRCWDHGCNGRTFSCLANYKRHLRERDRPVRAVCGSCGKPFSRKSNLEMHWSTGRCKGRDGAGEGSSSRAARGEPEEASEGEGGESRESEF